MESSSTPVQTGSVTPVEGSPASQASSTRSGSIVFTSPFEDTSGLDVFAQIAASAHPLPCKKIQYDCRSCACCACRKFYCTSISISNSSKYLSKANKLSGMQQNQNKRDSIDSTVSKLIQKLKMNMTMNWFRWWWYWVRFRKWTRCWFEV